MPLVHTEEVVWPAGFPAMQTFITGIAPVRRYRLWLHGRSLPTMDMTPSTVLVAVDDLHAICTCPASILRTPELRCCNKRPRLAGGNRRRLVA